MLSDKERQIRDSLANEEYRELLAIEHVNTTLALQIRKMREGRQWTQNDLAAKLGKHQETISQWEDPDYGRYTTKTLQAIAKVFDVALLQKYVSFSELVKDMMDLSLSRLCPTNYEQDKMNWEGKTLVSELHLVSADNMAVTTSKNNAGTASVKEEQDARKTQPALAA